MMVKLGDEFTKGELKAKIFYNSNAARSGNGYCLIETNRSTNQFLFSSSLEELEESLEENSWVKVNNKIINQMKTTTTVTENDKSGEITHFQNKEIFTNGLDVAMIILNIRQVTFSLLGVEYGHMVHVDLSYEKMITVLNYYEYKRFKGKVEFKQE